MVKRSLSQTEKGHIDGAGRKTIAITLLAGTDEPTDLHANVDFIGYLGYHRARRSAVTELFLPGDYVLHAKSPGCSPPH
ncbi:hypothetical protein MJ585_22875 [Klebsiella pneumoniae]|nr:hypothetical protein MJ585_22875 [Klebsiella pneumoniae]